MKIAIECKTSFYLAPFLRYSEILVEIHLHLAPPLGVIQLKFCRDFWQQKNSCLRDPTFSSFSTVPDRRTDGRTDGHTYNDSIYRASISSRGKMRIAWNEVYIAKHRANWWWCSMSLTSLCRAKYSHIEFLLYRTRAPRPLDPAGLAHPFRRPWQNFGRDAEQWQLCLCAL